MPDWSAVKNSLSLRRAMPSANGARRSRLSDAELIARCLAGEAEAWDALIDRYEGLVYTVLTRAGLNGADADDLFQEVCLLLLRHLGSLRDTERLGSWLISTARREAWRVQRKHRPSLLSEMPGETWENTDVHPPGQENHPSPEAALLALDDRRIVRESLLDLQPRCREMLYLLYCEDPPCTYAEVAERLGLPPGSIGPSRARCLQRLQKILEAHGF